MLDADQTEAMMEYHTLKFCRHKHIASLLEAFVENKILSLVFDPVEGDEIIRALAYKNKYTEFTISRIVSQVLNALQFLHCYGIVHLDLEPSNVVTVSRRRFDIKLVDFSCAKNVLSEEGEELANESNGTLEFMGES